MRKLFGAIAVLLAAVSILVTARYGYKLADAEVDGYIGAVMFGMIALCACVFDAAAVRLWFSGMRRLSIFIGMIAACALIVTFGNSLGGIVSRGDATMAERQKIADARATNRDELKRLTKERGSLEYTATDQAAVDAAKRAADTASENRRLECDKRGPNCRARELDEAAAASKLAAVTANKAATDRANRLDAEIAKIKAQLETGEAVANPNPLGSALEAMLGTAAASLTAWQSAIIAAVFELCLVGVMVAFEALGHAPPLRSLATISEPVPEIIAPPPRPKLVAARSDPPAGAVHRIMTAALEPAKGQRVELGRGYARYVSVCKDEGRQPVTPDQYMDAMVGFCTATGIKTRIEGDKLYLQNVQFVEGERSTSVSCARM